jgi:hypothetical protein
MANLALGWICTSWAGWWTEKIRREDVTVVFKDHFRQLPGLLLMTDNSRFISADSDLLWLGKLWIRCACAIHRRSQIRSGV